MSGFRDLIHEIHRRSIWQVLGIYIVASWVALQVVDLLVDGFGLPEWLPPFALALLVIGLPVVLATAFVQEGVGSGPPAADPGGEPSDPGAADKQEFPGDPPVRGASPQTGHPLKRLFTWRNAITGGVLAFALWGVVATLVLLRVGSGLTDAEGAASAGEDDPLHAVAVLPFENLSPDPDNAFFADGVHEDVLTHLSKIGDLTVISRTSVMAYRDVQKSMSEIGTELGVGAIVEGSVRRAGDEVRITAQLIDARTDEHLWADTYDRQLSAASVFALQTEIAQRIADALAATLTPAEEERIARAPTESLDALDFYLRGRAMYGRYSPAGNQEAIRLFKEALVLDPEYADAWAGLADAYGQEAFQFGAAAQWADSAEVAARRALRLDPDLAAGHKALALAYTAQRRDEAALEANRKAVQLDPNLIAAIGNIGVHYESRGQHAESMRWIRRAQRLGPTRSRVVFHIAVNWLAVGESDRAQRVAQQRLRLDPGDLQATQVLCMVAKTRGDPRADPCREETIRGVRDDPEARMSAAYELYFAGEHERAAALAALVEADAPGMTAGYHVRTLQGLALSLAGRADEGRAILEERRPEVLQLAADSEAGGPAARAAAIEAVLGNTDAAMEWLELAYERGTLRLTMDAEPTWDSLRDHPRWIALMERWDADLEQQRQRMLAEWGDTP